MSGLPVETGFRQIQVVFNPWADGHTTATVVTADYRGVHRVVHRIGSIRLDLGRQDLVGLAASQVSALLVSRLNAWLSDNAATIPGPAGPPAPPLGVTGAALQVPGQLSLDLDLTV